jgi:hypothetical protein
MACAVVVMCVHRANDAMDRAIQLWNLLDRIDTLDDSCRENAEVFRAYAREHLAKRHAVLQSDGYSLKIPRGGP